MSDIIISSPLLTISVGIEGVSVVMEVPNIDDKIFNVKNNGECQ